MTIVSIKINCTFSSYDIKMLSRFHNFDQVSYLAQGRGGTFFPPPPPPVTNLRISVQLHVRAH